LQDETLRQPQETFSFTREINKKQSARIFLSSGSEVEVSTRQHHGTYRLFLLLLAQRACE